MAGPPRAISARAGRHELVGDRADRRAIETKTRASDDRHLVRVREQAAWLSRRRRRERELRAELTALIEAHCPALLAEHGCGPITAAIIIGHTAGAKRFPTDVRFARHAGIAPIPANSGNTQRHRLHRGGDRQLNRAIHIIALSRARTDPATQAYLARKHAEGKSKAEAIGSRP